MPECCKNNYDILYTDTKKFYISSMFGFTNSINVANHVQFYNSTASRGWIKSQQTQGTNFSNKKYYLFIKGREAIMIMINVQQQTTKVCKSSD